MVLSGKLESLLPFRWEGCWWTRGRMGGKELLRHVGHEKLLILSNKSRYAKLLLLAAHERDHRQSSGDALHRTRQDGVWIIRGRNLAKSVVNNCPKCKILAPKLLQQHMGQLPPKNLRYQPDLSMLCVLTSLPLSWSRVQSNKEPRKRSFLWSTRVSTQKPCILWYVRDTLQKTSLKNSTPSSLSVGNPAKSLQILVHN